jgi:hypothetical protein
MTYYNITFIDRCAKFISKCDSFEEYKDMCISQLSFFPTVKWSEVSSEITTNWNEYWDRYNDQ